MAPDEAGQDRISRNTSSVIQFSRPHVTPTGLRPAEISFPTTILFETWPPWLAVGGHGPVVRDVHLFLTVLFISSPSSTISAAASHSSTSHELATTLLDLPSARSHSLSTQPIRDSLHCWQKISPCLKGSFNRTAPQ
jgi:hypothetical protein